METIIIHIPKKYAITYTVRVGGLMDGGSIDVVSYPEPCIEQAVRASIIAASRDGFFCSTGTYYPGISIIKASYAPVQG